MNGRFINKLVPIKDSSPPEELFVRLAGDCGKWQISVCAVAFVCAYIHSIDMELPAVIAPHFVNFTCASDNSSKCFVNGTKCETFIFKKMYSLTTLTETYSLVCHRRHLLFWVDGSYRLGMIIGNVLVGILADKLGSKIASMIFIPLYCLTGLVLATSTTFAMFCAFRLMHAFFSSSLYLLSTVARSLYTIVCSYLQISVCNNVGNKWRTFALAFTLYPMPLGWITLAIIPILFHNVSAVIAAISLAPLPVIIPLLYFRGSSLHFLVSSNYEKAEECFRKIIYFNGRTVPAHGIRLRPVKIMTSSADDEITSLSYSKFLRTKETRNPFLALLWLWFSTGVSFSILQFSLMTDVTPSVVRFIILTTCCLISTISSIALCHWIQHKIIICACLILKNISIAATILLRHYTIKNPDDGIIIAMILLSHGALWAGSTVLDNLTPRMLPTGLRFQGVGVLLSVLHAGRLLIAIPIYFIQTSIILWLGISFLLIVAPVSEAFCSLLLWNVHNRELPDFIEDCINFKKYFKPQRYVNIVKEDGVSLQEIEVESVHISSQEHTIK